MPSIPSLNIKCAGGHLDLDVYYNRCALRLEKHDTGLQTRAGIMLQKTPWNILEMRRAKRLA